MYKKAKNAVFVCFGKRGNHVFVSVMEKIGILYKCNRLSKSFLSHLMSFSFHFIREGLGGKSLMWREMGTSRFGFCAHEFCHSVSEMNHQKQKKKNKKKKTKKLASPRPKGFSVIQYSISFRYKYVPSMSLDLAWKIGNAFFFSFNKIFGPAGVTAQGMAMSVCQTVHHFGPKQLSVGFPWIFVSNGQSSDGAYSKKHEL